MHRPTPPIWILAALLGSGLAGCRPAPDAAGAASPTPLPGPIVVTAQASPQATLVALPLQSEEEASAGAGFAPYEPAYLPADYFLLVREAAPPESGLTAVHTLYQSGPGSSPPGFLSLWQAMFPDPAAAPAAAPGAIPPAPMTVRGQAGMWIERAAQGIPPGGADGWQFSAVNVLTWQEGAFTFALQSNLLGLEELLRVAESLEP